MDTPFSLHMKDLPSGFEKNIFLYQLSIDI